MRQKLEKNDRYQPFTKAWLISLGVDVVIDGVSTRGIPTKALKMFYYDYETLEIRQWSNKFKCWLTRKPVANTKLHEKGIIKTCTYYQIPLCIPHKSTLGVPIHRIIYAWFNDIIEPYNEKNEKLEVCHIDGNSSNNHILNLKLDTAKNNRAQRKGARNQHDTPRLKQYGINALYENE